MAIFNSRSGPRVTGSALSREKISKPVSVVFLRENNEKSGVFADFKLEYVKKAQRR